MIAVEMVKERLIDSTEAIKRVEPDSLSQILAPIFDRKDRAATVKDGRLLCKGLPAGPGAASGKVVFNPDDAEARVAKGEKVILVRIETSPEDLRGMIAAEGILTARGGVSSHAALVARQMGKICVCGASDLNIDYAKKTIKVAGKTIKEGDDLSIDGTAGEVFAGALKTAPSEVVQVLVEGSLKPEKSKTYQQFNQLMKWADKARTMDVRTNADQPDQVANAVAFGAQGIGLCRTEHMFFEGDRIYAVREMIMAETTEARKAALEKLLPYQREDFIGLFRELKGKPATIRLLDPPLHEFLPHDRESITETANKLGTSPAKIKARVAALHESNPMLGHRGCRLGITYPEITAMQARAIIEAAIAVKKERIKVNPEIMIPLVGFKKELDLQLEVVHATAAKVMKETKSKVAYLVGTMIEVPRAALTANQIAQSAEFFSFGTNDLTQTTLGMSRDDVGTFLGDYESTEIVPANPFASIDRDGVGQLLALGAKNGRKTNKNLKLGICGEHGGDPKSIQLCQEVGLNYVSCSPFRVPIARLAAAQAALG